jgi:hypothetical protein
LDEAYRELFGLSRVLFASEPMEDTRPMYEEWRSFWRLAELEKDPSGDSPG